MNRKKRTSAAPTALHQFPLLTQHVIAYGAHFVVNWSLTASVFHIYQSAQSVFHIYQSAQSANSLTQLVLVLIVA